MEQQGRSRETHTVEIFAVRGVGAKGELGVVTTATDLEPFILDLAAACARFASNEERKTTTQLEHDFGWIFRNAFPIAFKLSGYKADQVIERRTLMCGSNAPSPDDVVAAA